MVVELTSGNFDEIVGKEKYVVVKFYTKWCRYCRIMAPEYEKLYEDYQKGGRKDLVISRLEAGSNEEIARRYGIFSFPIVVIFNPNSSEIASIFQGRRTAEDMNLWIDRAAPLPEGLEDESESYVYDENVELLNNFNKTEAFHEIEEVKKNIDSLIERMLKLEGEIQNLKTISPNGPNPIYTNNNITAKDQEKLVILQNLRMPTVFEMVVGFGAMMTLVAVIMTFRRLIKSRKMHLPSHHAKV